MDIYGSISTEQMASADEEWGIQGKDRQSSEVALASADWNQLFYSCFTITVIQNCVATSGLVMSNHIH